MFESVEISVPNATVANKLIESVGKLGIWGDYTLDEETGKQTVVFLDVTKEDLNSIRSFATMYKATDIVISGYSRGAEILSDTADVLGNEILKPLAKDIVSAGYTTGTWMKQNIQEIKERPWETGNWSPLKGRIESIKPSFLLNKFKRREK